MADILDARQRSALMARVRPHNSKPERVVRSCLHGLGLRFRLHNSNLPGTPDIVLPRYRTVVFVHGCFWHRHSGCIKSTTPKTHRSFWTAKFLANVLRDRRVQRKLRADGWHVITLWECQTKDKAELVQRLRRRLSFISNLVRKQ